jgi:hypothetical protein
MIKPGMLPPTVAAVPLLVVLVALAGCGPDRTAGLAHVDGIVRRQGRPLAGATVVFIAEPPHTAPLAFGAVGDDGGYRLLSANRYPGVPPGRYLVCVTMASEAADGSSDPLAPGERPEGITGSHARPETTPLRFDVPQVGGSFDINLP